ncbi:MAG TPA: NAD(P)H-dependent glycerol-3-phosphate dehydrogenase [Syntrophomonas sp.]|nr:NAD(P)H-dependent glycerol-3-phosphate dehydrogenase [Syntrophomonas sp.]
MRKICILGAGSWGTALAAHLANLGFSVILWGRPEDGIDLIRSQHENRRFLPGVVLPDNIYPETDAAAALKAAEAVVFSLPSQALRPVLEQVKPYIPEESYLVNTAKGLEISTGMRLSQVFYEIVGSACRDRFAVLSGPSHAEEVGRRLPTAVTVASCNQDTAFYIQDIFMDSNFRVYTNPDIAGVELGGALKNVIALATGVAYGLGYGDNTAAALLTRGLAEIIRMGAVMGGDPRTFSGLSGLGDLVVTCGSQHSRNRRAGQLIGQGKSLEETLETVGMVVEGVHTTRIAHRLATEMNIEMPLTRACYRILYEDQEPRREVEELMQRRRKHEVEEMSYPG